MSGHSKWHNIQGRKGKADKAKSGQFTRASRMITVATREGGADPETNFSLRLAITKAKEVNMPKDTIERAIKKGSGELKDGEQLETLLYEGFGPGGVAILIDVLTDNRNRSASDIKHMVSKLGGTLGAPGSVQWQFEKRAVIRITAEVKQQVASWDSAELAFMDAGVLDIQESQEGVVLLAEQHDFARVVHAAEKLNIPLSESGIEWLPKDTLTIDDASRAALDTFMDTLYDMDDVNTVYTNAE